MRQQFVIEKNMELINMKHFLLLKISYIPNDIIALFIMVNGPYFYVFFSLLTTKSSIALHVNIRPFTPVHTLMTGTTIHVDTRS